MKPELRVVSNQDEPAKVARIDSLTIARDESGAVIRISLNGKVCTLPEALCTTAAIVRHLTDEMTAPVKHRLPARCELAQFDDGGWPLI